MNQIELQARGIEALKLFNNTIVTSRLYPAEAPQVANVVDRGYSGLKSFLSEYGDLQFSLEGGSPSLCGQLLSPETLEAFPNLVIYRQLRLLELPILTIHPEMDRFAFGQLLLVFNASVERIKKGGGGLAYITGLGLASYFPDPSEKLDAQGGRTDDLRARNLIKVRPELVVCLLGKDKRPVIVAELREKMATAETAMEVLAACVGHILKNIQKKKTISASEDFPLMVETAEMLITPNDKSEVAQGLAKILVESLREPALCVVLVQEYPDGFGSEVYDQLLATLTTEKLGGIVTILREQLDKARRRDGTNSSRVQFLNKALISLLDSKKGKHFLSLEKARSLMMEGEKERKKRRLEAGLKNFLQGNNSVLKSVELIEFLPDAIAQIQKGTANADISSLLMGMVTYLKEGGAEGKESLLNSMVTIGENLALDGQWLHVDHLLEPLMEEISQGSSEGVLVEKIVTFLQEIMQKSWQDGDYDRGDRILNLLHRIRSGKIPRPAEIKSIVAKVQDRGIQRAELPRLLEQCLAAPNDGPLRFRLILQGPVALRFLIESLIASEDAVARLKIIDLLTYCPDFLPSVILERLEDHMTWHGKRNLIKLLGETGQEKDAESLLPYLRHNDFRVQRETFLTLYKISGQKRRQLLLRALDESSDSIRPQIVGALANYCDPEVAGKLVELLASHEQFDEENRKPLLLQLLETLGRCPCPPALKGVQAFLGTRGQRATRKIPEQIWNEAEKALKFLQKELQEARKKHVQASKLRKNSLKQAAKLSKAGMAQRVITGLPEEQTIGTYLARGEKTAAAEQILLLIERVARMRNFNQAEKLREWLIEIDPVALSQIVRAAEIIDREKVAAIDKSHLEIWAGLYDVLSTDEFTTVYHALHHKKYEKEEVIISQGALQGSLFFINSGNVRLYFGEKDSEVLIKTMGRGEIFGAAAFFEASVWTISVATIEPTELSVLTLDALQEWTEKFPGLDVKLKEFCNKYDKIEDIIKQNSSDRRSYKRYRISGRVVATLVNNRGRSLGTEFKVELLDISEGGISVLARISQKENGRLLLGRKLQLEIPAVEKMPRGISITGEVLAVKHTYAVENDYSLHMKFDNLIDRKQLHDIVIAMRRESQAIK